MTVVNIADSIVVTEHIIYPPNLYLSTMDLSQSTMAAPSVHALIIYRLYDDHTLPCPLEVIKIYLPEPLVSSGSIGVHRCYECYCLT